MMPAAAGELGLGELRTRHLKETPEPSTLGFGIWGFGREGLRLVGSGVLGLGAYPRTLPLPQLRH